MAVPDEGVWVDGGSARADFAPPPRKTAEPKASLLDFQGAAFCALALIGIAALFARIQNYPLRHDEQFYVPAGILYTIGGIYRDFGFNQPPNLPIMLNAAFQLTGDSHFLLIGRTVIFFAWLATGGLLAVMTANASRSRVIAAFCVALFALDPVLLGPAGMAVTNSFLPIPFALAGLYLFLRGSERGASGGLSFFFSGCALAVAMGLKANYIFLAPAFVLAALAMPSTISFKQRLARVMLPLALGGIVGSAPSLLYFLSDPDGFLAHVTRYHRGAQIQYWVTDGEAEDGQAITITQKLLLAQKIWLMDAGGLMALALLFLGLLRLSAGRRQATASAGTHALTLVLGLAALATLISFVPTPAFPQYYVPPLPFVVVAIALLYGQLAEDQRAAAVPGLIAIALFLVLTGGPRLLGELPKLRHPSNWTGIAFHQQAEKLARATAGDDAPIATLAPLYPLEARKPIYPELAAGFVLYRVGDYLGRSEGRNYRYLASPTTIGSILEREPPSAILVGTEGKLDEPFVAFARNHGYSLSPVPIIDRRNGNLALLVRSAAATGKAPSAIAGGNTP